VGRRGCRVWRAVRDEVEVYKEQEIQVISRYETRSI